MSLSKTDDAELYTSAGSCVLLMFSEVPLDEYSSFTRATGYKRVAVRDLIAHAKTKTSYVEVSIAPFGINIFSDLQANLAAETELLVQSHGFNNPLVQSTFSAIVRAASATIAPVIESLSRSFIRANRDTNTPTVFFHAGTNTLVIHLRAYSGLGGRNALGMECLKRALSVPGVKSINIVSARIPYIEVLIIKNHIHHQTPPLHSTTHPA